MGQTDVDAANQAYEQAHNQMEIVLDRYGMREVIQGEDSPSLPLEVQEALDAFRQARDHILELGGFLPDDGVVPGTTRSTPYGSWKSPITAELIVSATVPLGQTVLDGDTIYWSERRSAEGGRNVIMRRTTDGTTTQLTPAGFNVRSRVHEYGGGAFTVVAGTVYFVNFSDQRIYRQEDAGEPTPVTPDDGMRYADFAYDAAQQRLLCVFEDHSGAGEPQNGIGSVALTGENALVKLATGHDFASTPRISPDGQQLVWLTWDHPNMPWHGTDLWQGSLRADGSLGEVRHILGGSDESIFQPTWSPEGVLYFVSDRSNWWNLYRWQDGTVQPVCPKQAEFGEPAWIFGMTTFGFAAPDRLICMYSSQGRWQLASLDLTTGTLSDLQTPFPDVVQLTIGPNRAVCIGASPFESAALFVLDLATGASEILQRASNVTIDAAYISVAEPIEFSTDDGKTAYGFYYAPHNRDAQAQAGELPPLIVMSHGGPTSATSRDFSLGKQFWTSRGFAVLDVNYGGSTGYGREYRQRLEGQWGIVDVADCINGARYLVARGLVDAKRLAITGGSAGGYTTLCALTFHEDFAAGASYYGISDLEALRQDSHKFESRDVDRFIGTYPEHRDTFYERSPIHFAERIASPVIFFQGLEDLVVPPNQTELMVASLRAKGLPVAYLAFAGEQHGFRKAENIKRSLEAELYFYGRVFGFTPADAIEPVTIDNLP